MPEQRLNRYVSLAAAVSRRTADEMIRAGRVTLDGIPVTDPGTHFDDGTREVRIDGGSVVPIAEEKIYVLLNKPDKVVTTMHDKEGRATVASLVGALSTRVFPVGRLDFHTTGLLLMTNDGELAWKLTHPRFGVEKSYVAKVQGTPDRKAVTRLRKGILVDGEMTNPADVRIVESRGDKTWVVLTIAEGRYHQVRKMFDAVGHRVMKLRRVAVGPIKLTVEETGEWRFLTPQEIRDLFAYVAAKEKEAGKHKVLPGRKYHAKRTETFTEKKTRSERAKVKASEDRDAERARAVERGELPPPAAEEHDEWPDWLGGSAPKRDAEEIAPRREAPRKGKGSEGVHAAAAPREGERPKGRPTTTAKPKPSKGEGRPATTTPRSKPSKGEGRATTTAKPKPPKGEVRPATTTPRSKPSKGEGRATTTPRPKPPKGDAKPRRDGGKAPRKGAPPPRERGERDERPHKWSAPPEGRNDRPRRPEGDAPPPRRDGGREFTPGGPQSAPGGGLHRPEGGFKERGKGKGHVAGPGKKRGGGAPRGDGDGPKGKGAGKGAGKASGKAPGRKGPGASAGRSGGPAPKGKGGRPGGKGGTPSKGKGTGKGRGGGR